MKKGLPPASSAMRVAMAPAIGKSRPSRPSARRSASAGSSASIASSRRSHASGASGRSRTDRHALSSACSARCEPISSTAGACGPLNMSRSRPARVRVAPLQVVDGQHHRPPRGQGAQQFRKRHRRAVPELLGADDLGTPRRARLYLVHPLQHREHLRQQRDVLWQQRTRFLGRQLRQVTAERVDQAVERLVAHRLLLVTAPRQHQRLGA